MVIRRLKCLNNIISDKVITYETPVQFLLANVTEAYRVIEAIIKQGDIVILISSFLHIYIYIYILPRGWFVPTI